MTNAPMWAHIPVELTQRSQWCIAGPDKAPHAVGPNGRLYRASVTDPRTWMTFTDAATYAYAHGMHIGYVISDNDPYACIDLDVCDAESQARKGEPIDPSKWTTPQEFDRYWSIVQHFNSYTERSTYGKGLHIWVRANIGHGCKRDGVEVYSQERFIICTGDRISQVGTLEDRQLMLENMVSQMRGIRFEEADLVELEEEDSDEEIYERASTAGNAEKFNDLCAGNWQKYGFPSQSEADLALMSMFTFYSKSNEQCRRLFRCTALGKREKAVKDDRYLNYTLRVIRGRQAQEEKLIDSGRRSAEALIARMNERAQAAASTPMSVPPSVEPAPQRTPTAVAAAQAAPVTPQVLASMNEGLPYPPGCAGYIAQFIYGSAPRPVKEVAIVATLGFLAGVCGKAWYIQGSGLNIYMILVARSAIGKEAMHSGISALLKSCVPMCPGIMQFVNFNDFASGPALTKACAASSSFVNVAGEWGRKLRRLAQDDGREGPMATLRTVMTNLYQKSGPQSIVGGINYSNAENNVQSVSGVAFSMIGETTPSTFYDSLNEGMMEDGFLSRFNVVEYDGPRPPLNTNPVLEVNKPLAEYLAGLARKALQVNSTMGGNIPVERDTEAANLIAAFELECDQQINSTTDEAWRQMWNRAALKVMRIAALLAVADDYGHPCVRKAHVEWAMMLVRKDIAIMQRHIESGDVGMSDYTRERKVLAIMSEYLTQGAPEGYKVPEKMQQNGIIPRKYLQTRCARAACFSQHKLGSTAALDMVLRSLIDSGYIMESDKKSLNENFNFHGKAYMILNLP